MVKTKRATENLNEDDFREFLYKLKNSELYKAKEILDNEIKQSETAIKEGYEKRL